MPEYNQANVCDKIVANNLCIGCGVCVAMCPEGNLTIQWNSRGEYNPVTQGTCHPDCNFCLTVCPFADGTENEETIARKRFSHIQNIKYSNETGFYLNAYVGHVITGQYRNNGASGGLASWVLCQLLETDMVDYVVCTLPHAGPKPLFTYGICSTPEEVRSAASSAYYPVELSKVLQHIQANSGRYAIICLPCAAKAIRLACAMNPRLMNSVKFLLGLACGQNKSHYFSEFCVSNCEGEPSTMRKIKFRVKRPDDYSKMGYKCSWGDSDAHYGEVYGWKKGFGKVWDHFAFTMRPCLFCDDVFAEVADIVFMDAWLPEFKREYLGTSIVLTRIKKLQELLTDGICRGDLHMVPLATGKVIESQKTQINNKKRAIAYRLAVSRKKADHVPVKRISPAFTGFSILERVRNLTRMRIQKESSRMWAQSRDAKIFLFELRKLNRLNRLLEWLQKRLMRVLQRVARSKETSTKVLVR